MKFYSMLRENVLEDPIEIPVKVIHRVGFLECSFDYTYDYAKVQGATLQTGTPVVRIVDDSGTQPIKHDMAVTGFVIIERIDVFGTVNDIIKTNLLLDGPHIHLGIIDNIFNIPKGSTVRIQGRFTI